MMRAPRRGPATNYEFLQWLVASEAHVMEVMAKHMGKLDTENQKRMMDQFLEMYASYKANRDRVSAIVEGKNVSNKD